MPRGVSEEGEDKEHEGTKDYRDDADNEKPLLGVSTRNITRARSRIMKRTKPRTKPRKGVGMETRSQLTAFSPLQEFARRCKANTWEILRQILIIPLEAHL